MPVGAFVKGVLRRRRMNGIFAPRAALLRRKVCTAPGGGSGGAPTVGRYGVGVRGERAVIEEKVLCCTHQRITRAVHTKCEVVDGGERFKRRAKRRDLADISLALFVSQVFPSESSRAGLVGFFVPFIIRTAMRFFLLAPVLLAFLACR